MNVHTYIRSREDKLKGNACVQLIVSISMQYVWRRRYIIDINWLKWGQLWPSIEMCKKNKAEEEAKWPIYDMNLMTKKKIRLKKGLEKELRNEFWIRAFRALFLWA